MTHQSKDVVINQEGIDTIAKHLTEVREYIRKLTITANTLSYHFTTLSVPKETSHIPSVSSKLNEKDFLRISGHIRRVLQLLDRLHNCALDVEESLTENQTPNKE